jgi:hypothetical protein
MTGLPHIYSAPEIIFARQFRGPNFFLFAACFTRHAAGAGLASGVGSPSPFDLADAGLAVTDSSRLVSS